MSMATLERAILHGARVFFNNPKLRHKDIREWSTGAVGKNSDEVQAYIADLGVNVAVSKECDKRKSK